MRPWIACFAAALLVTLGTADSSPPPKRGIVPVQTPVPPAPPRITPPPRVIRPPLLRPWGGVITPGDPLAMRVLRVPNVPPDHDLGPIPGDPYGGHYWLIAEGRSADLASAAGAVSARAAAPAPLKR